MISDSPCFSGAARMNIFGVFVFLCSASIRKSNEIIILISLLSVSGSALDTIRAQIALICARLNPSKNGAHSMTAKMGITDQRKIQNDRRRLQIAPKFMWSSVFILCEYRNRSMHAPFDTLFFDRPEYRNKTPLGHFLSIVICRVFFF